MKIINDIKITIIVPVFNCENSIKSTIRSIQNQIMKETEIILVNDFSKDNSFRIIKDLSYKDSRIKIINNNKNMGTLYSRCIGTLQSKGKYILALDNDDLFINNDLFDIVFQEAEKSKYDILGFKAIRGVIYHTHIYELIDDIYHNIQDNLVLYQPELGMHSLTKNGEYFPNDIHIWGKCINTNIYKKAVNALGKKRYSYFMSWAEDTSMVFILFNLASSYKFISKYGVFHLMSIKTSSFTQPYENKMFGEIYLLEIIFEFSKNDYSSKKLVVGKLLELRKFEFFNIQNKFNFKYLQNILKKILESVYITKEDKLKIKQNYIPLVT